jgi:hypothetical protein
VVDVAGGGGVWESNPPTGGLTRSTGFEVQGPHQQPNASRGVILKTYTVVVKLKSPDCARKCARQPPCHLLQIARADNVIPVEHGACFMPCYLHRDSFGHT